jgi:hypothetical protein
MIFVLLIKCYSDDAINADESGATCSMHERGEKFMYVFSGKS